MRTLGPELSVELFSDATWTSKVVSPVAADYPGLRPTGSWRLNADGTLHGLEPSVDGWRDRKTGEDVDLTGRHLLLAYGSNPDPGKLLAHRGFLGGQSVIALRAAVFGWAAVWCDARRHSDGSVVATLVRAPGRVEVHPILVLTPHQVAVMDRWEGHPHRYRRQHHADRILLESHEWADDDVQVYLGTAELRPPLIVEGRHLLCADVPQADVDTLVAPLPQR